MKAEPKHSKKKILLIQGLILLVLLAPVVIPVGFLFPSEDDLCGNDNLVETVSPNGHLKAVTFRRNCGATTAYSTQVSILPAPQQLPNKGGNIFAQVHEPIILVRWLDDSHLTISGGDAGTAFHLTNFGGVLITYD
jgi:hypothetical protein